MNETQISALRRIIKREIAGYRPRSRWPAPGQHHSADKFVVTDGHIFVFLDSPIINLPFGKRADKFIQIIQDEQMCRTHIPVPAGQIDFLTWTNQTRNDDDYTSVELSVRNQNGQIVSGRFDPQLLVDAVEVVGSSSLLLLALGPQIPNLLVVPSGWTEQHESCPIVVVLSTNAKFSNLKNWRNDK